MKGATACLVRGGGGVFRSALTKHARVLVLAALALGGLAGCADTALFNHATKSIGKSSDPVQMSGAARGGIYQVGHPYQISGVWYYPQEDPTYDENGIGSWYGWQFHGAQKGVG